MLFLILYIITGVLISFMFSTSNSEYPIIYFKKPKNRFQCSLYIIFLPIMLLCFVSIQLLVIFTFFIMIPIYIVDFLYNVKSNGLNDNKFIRKIKSNKFYKFMFKEF